MSNSVRNTIVVAALFILIGSVMILLNVRMESRIVRLNLDNRKTERAIDSLHTELAVIDSLRAEFELKQALLTQQSKLIIGEDSTTTTYGYLLNLLRRMARSINYDFAANEAKDSLNSYHEYIISGSSRYTNLLHLAHQLENQRIVITIEDLSIATEGAARADTVTFSMILHTHYRTGGPLADELTLKDLPPPYTGYDTFQPRIHEEILPLDPDSMLLNSEEATLIGITRDMAFLRDDRGIIHILTRGSVVAYGYLYRIDEEAGKVVFRLNKYGLEEDYTKSIQNYTR